MSIRSSKTQPSPRAITMPLVYVAIGEVSIGAGANTVVMDGITLSLGAPLLIVHGKSTSLGPSGLMIGTSTVPQYIIGTEQLLLQAAIPLRSITTLFLPTAQLYQPEERPYRKQIAMKN